MKIFYHVKSLKIMRGEKFRGLIELLIPSLTLLIALGLFLFPLIGSLTKERRIANYWLSIFYGGIILTLFIIHRLNAHHT
jgi:hypothetical protein